MRVIFPCHFSDSPMKLATYKDGSRDGQLVVVARDLSTAHYATGIANRLQQVLDDWNFMAPQLQDLSDRLNNGKARHAFAFDPKQCMAPLPRAYQWVGSAAYGSHASLLPQTGEPNAANAPRLPLMYQGRSDELLGPCDDVLCGSEAHGPDFEAGLAVITGDVRMGTPAASALDSIRLLLLANSISLRQLLAVEQARGAGSCQGRPVTAFSPVAVTLDELGADWDQGRLHLSLQSTWNGRKVGLCDTGPEMTFHFGQLIAHLCTTRNVRAGTIVGSGPVSNAGVKHKGRLEWPKGYHCIAEKRAMETLQEGQPATDYLKYGDTLRIEMKGRDGKSLLGAIEQEIVAPESAASASR
jgi:fumarylacetoacetate (FAA) hydrolase